MNERSPQPDNNQGAPERGGAISSGHRLLTESAADFEERYRSLGDNIGAFAIAGTRATETLYQDLLALVSPE